MKFYQFCASKLSAIRNCVSQAVIHASDSVENTRWLEMAESHRDALETAVKNFAPSGSGFDSGTILDEDASTDKKLVFRTAFHHMNETGYYDGWTWHTVIVRPAFDGVLVSVGGRNRNDIKEYISDQFYNIGLEELDRAGARVA